MKQKYSQINKLKFNFIMILKKNLHQSLIKILKITSN